jgi:hypothetical protein
MKKRYILLAVFLISFLTKAQQIQILHSPTKSLDVREGDVLNKDSWFLAPEVNPDVYSSSKIGEHVTFISPIDSITFVIHPDSIYNFIVVHEQDSAYSQVIYQPSYLDILKKAVQYDSTDYLDLPHFTYQDSSARQLRNLRKTFNLDSIAGSGDEISRLLNVMHWVHDGITHNGNQPNPLIKNARHMINVCKSKNKALNCRGLAIVLNECYLALGYKSMYVTCMPKDSIFSNCHVINTVFSHNLQKWIWLDPTHDTYVTDENGDFLGIQEVREYLTQDKPLLINPSANWNNQYPTEKIDYLDEYMAKNLYRLECPLHSSYNYETPKRKKKTAYVELLPLDAYQQTPKYAVFKNRFPNRTYIQYKTTNSILFWRNPDN